MKSSFILEYDFHKNLRKWKISNKTKKSREIVLSLVYKGFLAYCDSDACHIFDGISIDFTSFFLFVVNIVIMIYSTKIERKSTSKKEKKLFWIKLWFDDFLTYQLKLECRCQSFWCQLIFFFLPGWNYFLDIFFFSIWHIVIIWCHYIMETCDLQFSCNLSTLRVCRHSAPL